MKSKIKEILEKFKGKAIFKKCIDVLKTNWKKVAIIAGAVIIVAVIVIVSHSIRANNIKKDVINQLNGKTFEYFSESGNNSWHLDSYTFQEDGEYIENIYYYYGGDSDSIDHTSYDGTVNIKVSLFGKVTVGINEVIFNDGEIEALKSSITDDIYEMVEISHLKRMAIDVLCEMTKWSDTNFGEMIDIIFKDYNVTVTAVEGSDTKFIVTFDGNYYPAKLDLPNYTDQDALAVEVDIATREGKVIEGYNVIQAMEIYVAFS